MGQFAPEFVFTDPTLASQMVRLSELNAAHKNEQQRLSTQLALQYAALRSREQQQQGNQAYQYAALANQQRAQDLADKRAAAELASRENMFGQQMGLSREGLQLQRELGLANPYGRAAGDILLGGMQTNNQIEAGNAEANTESPNLRAALNGRYEKFVRDYNGVPDEISGFRHLAGSVGGIFPHGWIPGVDTTADAITHRRESLRDQYLQDRNALIAAAKHSSFVPGPAEADLASLPPFIQFTPGGGGDFRPSLRSQVQIPGMGRLNGQQATPAPAPGPNPDTGAYNPTPVPQAGGFYRQLWGGAPPQTPPGAGVIGGGLDGLKQQYLNGDISPEEYLQQFDGLNQ